MIEIILSAYNLHLKIKRPINVGGANDICYIYTTR